PNDAFAGPDANFSWTAIGPAPMRNERANFGGAINGPTFTASGRGSALWVDSQGRLYVGTAGGGLVVGSGGQSAPNTGEPGHCAPISDNLPATNPGIVVNSIGSLAVDGGSIYLGTGEGNSCFDCYYGQGVFRSIDLGQHWTPLARFPLPAGRDPT